MTRMSHLMHTGQALDTGGEVHGGADEPVLHALARADQPGEPRSAVDADAERERGQSLGGQLDVIRLERRPHRERGAHGVVALPGIRLYRAEVGEDAVTEEGGHVPAVLMDGIAHALEGSR